MKIAVLGSGSSGNSILIESEKTKILIDAGFSGKKIKEKLEQINRDINHIDAIFVTHEHGDHILGVGIISRKYDIPIYITKESYEEASERLGKIKEENLKFIDSEFRVGDLDIIPFDVMHDAVRTIGYRIEDKENSRVIGIATDIGYVTNLVKEHLKKVDVLVIESNYDYQMLMTCKYPWSLKSRVKSNNGHLSNDDALNLVRDIYDPRLKKVYFVHVSRDSNCYNLATKNAIETFKKFEIDIEFELIKQEKISSFYTIE